MAIEYNKNYIHHSNPGAASMIREIVFGMEDGMVSTLGSITGIAAATQNPFTTVLAGLVIIAVESISMGVGSYLSNKSEKEIDERKIFEEKQEIERQPDEERDELLGMYIKDGWPGALAEKMADFAKTKPEIMLKEMSFRELEVIPESLGNPVRNGIAMMISYVIGGVIPLCTYLFLPVYEAIFPSIVVTLLGLFTLGVVTTRFTKRSWWKAGFEMLILGSMAALIGYAVGQAVDNLWLKND